MDVPDHPGWAIGGNITYGEVAAYKNYVFASNMQSLNGVAHGMVRFDTTGGAPVLFAPNTGSLQITLGLDGLLYELVGNGSSPAPNPTIEAYDPNTLALVKSIHLTTPFTSDIRSIAVDGSGNIYAADWSGTLTKYDPNGNQIGSSLLLTDPTNGYGENLMNVAIDNNGQIAVGGRFGGIYLTDESLNSYTRIATGQWDAFVTFDHYIGTAPQTVTPSFSSLAAPTITYGQGPVTLGGVISAGANYPAGSVNITLNGVTEAAPINSTNGTFSASFDTSTLGASGSPYTITYSYPGAGNYGSVTDASKSLTVNKAVTSLSNLSSPAVVYGTPTTTFAGTVGSNSVLPSGQNVSVTLTDAKGNVAASGSGTIASNGQFSTSINTGSLAAGSYSIQYSYAGDNNFQGSSDSSRSFTVSQASTSLSNLSAPTAVYGAPTATFSGTVGSNSVLPVGQNVSVTLTDAKGNVVGNGSGTIGSNGQFSTSINTASLAAGSYAIQYSYAGDNNFQGSSDTSKSLTVSPATTSLSNLASPTIGYGTPSATFSGTVGSNSVLPVGQSVAVTLTDAKGNVVGTGSGAIGSDGTFSTSINTGALATGSYAILYSYAGDGNFSPVSDSSKSLTIGQGTTSLSNLSAPTIVYGTASTIFSGKISSNTVSSNSVLPVGEQVAVTLTDAKGNVVGTGSGTIAGDGTFSTSINTGGLSASSYHIQYSYAGDSNFTGTSDSSKTLTISQATTSLSNLSAPTIVYGTASTTFSGTVGSNSILPAGQSVSVTLTDAKGNVAGTGSGTIASNGQFSTSINTGALTAGSYSIQYSYAGDSNFTGTSDSSKSLTVSQATISLSNLASPTIVYGTSSASFSGKVNSNSILPVNQQVSVTLTDSKGNAVASGSGTIGSSGLFSASINTGSLVAGSYSIQYSYTGDSNFSPVSDSSKTLTVTQATTALSNLSAPTITYGTASTTFSGTLGSNTIVPASQSVSVTLTDAKGNVAGTGSGTIASDGSFQVSIKTAQLPAGSYTVQYSYAGDSNFKGTSDSSKSLTVRQAATTLTNLSSPTIVYGNTASFSGTISATGSTAVPANQQVTVTLTDTKGNVAGTGSGTIASDGSFKVGVNTSTLLAGSYHIQYSYAGDSNFAGTSDSSKTLTVTQATTALTNLSSPNIIHGTPTTTFSGTLTAASTPALPVGEKVTVTLTNSKGSVVGSGSGAIGSNGQFAVTINTGSLANGSYTIHYSYAGDTNFKGSSGTGTLQVRHNYEIKPLYDASKPVHSGAALPVRLQVTDDAGNNLSSANLVVTALSIVGADGKVYTPQAKGHANPGDQFRNDGSGYLFNLDTTGLPPGTYTLFLQVGDDPTPYPVTFVIAGPKGHGDEDRD